MPTAWGLCNSEVTHREPSRPCPAGAPAVKSTLPITFVCGFFSLLFHSQVAGGSTEGSNGNLPCSHHLLEEASTLSTEGCCDASEVRRVEDVVPDSRYKAPVCARRPHPVESEDPLPLSLISIFYTDMGHRSTSLPGWGLRLNGETDTGWRQLAGDLTSSPGEVIDSPRLGAPSDPACTGSRNGSLMVLEPGLSKVQEPLASGGQL